ncbi:MAG: hypothetical protein ABL970_12620 [Nitrospira sp.]
MPSFSRTLYYLHKSEGFAEHNPNGQAIPMDPTVLIFSGVYLSQAEITPGGLGKGKLGLSQAPARTLLRPVPSSDAPPFWSAIIYQHAGDGIVNVRGEYPAVRSHFRELQEQASIYHANPPGGNNAWETDISSGNSGYFLTGGSGPNALWRIMRTQVDALNRQVLTLAPVQLTPTLALPSFEKAQPQLREFLAQHFAGFQQALVRNAPFDAIDRANNLTEGIVSHCLTLTKASPPDTLDKMLKKAKDILEREGEGKGFPLTYYGYNLAQQIRVLHARLHQNQSVGQGKTVRPEVGLNLSVTVSELLVEVGLGKY